MIGLLWAALTLTKPDPLMLKITDPVDARLFLAEGKKRKKYRDMR